MPLLLEIAKNGSVFRYPPPLCGAEGLTRVSAGQTPYLRLLWQVKDSNLRSFRDGFTVRRRRACHLRLHRHTGNLATNRPQTLDASRRPADTSGHRSTTTLVSCFSCPPGPVNVAPLARAWRTSSRTASCSAAVNGAASGFRSGRSTAGMDCGPPESTGPPRAGAPYRHRCRGWRRPSACAESRACLVEQARALGHLPTERSAAAGRYARGALPRPATPGPCRRAQVTSPVLRRSVDERDRERAAMV
jgi:hypothetical protein